MPKPIALLLMPENMWRGFKRDCNNIQSAFDGNYPDYYWLFAPDFSLSRIELQLFYEKDFTEIQYSELRKLIEDSLKQLTTPENTTDNNEILN